MVRAGLRRDEGDGVCARLVRAADPGGHPAQPDVHLPETGRPQRERGGARVEQVGDLVRGAGRARGGAGEVGVAAAARDRGGDGGLRGENKEDKEKKRERIRRERGEDEKEKKTKGKNSRFFNFNKKNIKQIDRAVTSALAEGYTTLREPATLSNNNGKPFNATLQKAIGKVRAS